MPDLVNLFVQPGPTPAFAQGTLVAFDPLTGDNQVNVLGQVFTNLALLNVPDVVNMTVGSVVMLAQLGGSYAIMGRVIVPGSALLNTAAVAISQGSASVAGAGLTTTPTAIAAALVVVPAWANAMSFLAIGDATFKNSTASADNMAVFVQYVGSFGTGNGAGLTQSASSLFVAAASASAAQHVLTVTPGETIAFSTMVSSASASWAATGSNQAGIDALCIFQRV